MALVSATQLTQGKTVFWFLVLPWLYRIGVIVFVARSYPSMSERFAGWYGMLGLELRVVMDEVCGALRGAPRRD